MRIFLVLHIARVDIIVTIFIALKFTQLQKTKDIFHPHKFQRLPLREHLIILPNLPARMETMDRILAQVPWQPVLSSISISQLLLVYCSLKDHFPLALVGATKKFICVPFIFILFTIRCPNSHWGNACHGDRGGDSAVPIQDAAHHQTFIILNNNHNILR